MTKKYAPKVSVVINTADRAKYIGDTLRGLTQQSYDNFEVIVVNGPSQDNTEEVVKQFNIRYYEAPFNLSVSRNIGIKHAAGDIIAFIDDDAVPSPTWLEEIVEEYRDEHVGAVGGWVYHVGSADYQFKYGAITKWGMPILKSEKDFDYNQPNADTYNINIGTNATYRRSYLVEIGGFDEEIEYYHDESDVCVRMIDAGHKVVELEGAIVHHKMAPSSRRSSWRNVTNWDSIVKNGVYFAVRHSKGKASALKRVVMPFHLHKQKYKLIFLAMIHGELRPWQYVYRLFSLNRAFTRGYIRGFLHKPKLMQNYTYRPKEFKPYKVKSRNRDSKQIVLVTQGFPPAGTDGIARYNYTLAKEFAAMGHQVHVVTRETGDGRGIQYHDGFWVHYHKPEIYREVLSGYERLDDIVALTKSVYKQVESISSQVNIDFILAPLWDVEGLALVRKKLAPTIVTLMSPLKKVVETQWSGIDDPSIDVLYDLERLYIEEADGVMSISEAIKQTIGEQYAIDWSRLNVKTIPLGVDTGLFHEARNRQNGKNIELLFVGRFEHRKGIDLLLNILPKLLADHDDVTVRLVGNASITDADGKSIYQDFTKQYQNQPWFKRITQSGYISDDELAEAYAQCTIFVAPSRYESFGLIFIEAMMNGKPVVGSRVGGIPEIIDDGVNGLLFESENETDLHDKLEILIRDARLRHSMGEAGKATIVKKFGVEKTAQQTIDFATGIDRTSLD